MSKRTLEERLTTLEQQVAILLESRKAASKKRNPVNGRHRQPLVSRNQWQRTLGAFGPEDGMDEVFDAAMKLRELNRRKSKVDTQAESRRKSVSNSPRKKKLVQS